MYLGVKRINFIVVMALIVMVLLVTPSYSADVDDAVKKNASAGDENSQLDVNEADIVKTKKKNRELDDNEREAFFEKYADYTGLFKNYGLFWAEERSEGNQIFAQYIQSQASEDNWGAMITIIDEKIPDRYQNKDEYVKKYAGAISSIIYEKGRMIKSSFYGEENKGLSYLDYTVGDGKDLEHILSVIWSKEDGRVTNFQYIRKAGIHSQNGYKKFYMIMNLVQGKIKAVTVTEEEIVEE